MKRTCKAMGKVALAAAALLAGASTAFSAGFSLMEQNVSGLGNAYAGAAAVAEDASTIFYNPAGLVRIKGQNMVASGHLISPTIQLKDTGTTSVTGTDATGGNGGEAGVTKYLPNVYYAYGMDRFTVGLGVYVPFGLATSYNGDWAGRYFATESSLKTININPAVAYRVEGKFSVGLGLSAQYLSATLGNAVNFGAGVNPALSQAFDGDVKLTADGWAYGYTLGVLLEPTESTRVGAAYHSRYKYNLDGDADFTHPTFTSPPLADQPTADFVNNMIRANYADTGAETEITMPDIASFSLYQQLNPQWAVLADVTWTNWSVFNQLKVEFDSGLADSISEYKWKDAWRYSLGVTYTPTASLALKAGVAYDESPVPNATYRTPRVPDADRTWLSFGGAYRFTDNIKLDGGYTHIFVKDTEIRNTSDPAKGTLNADVESFVDIFSLQLTMNF